MLRRVARFLGRDYMANFSPASETNPLKIKLLITWRVIQPGLKILARFLNRARISAQPNGPENLKKISCNRNGILAWAEN